MNDTEWQIRRELYWYANWLANNPNIQMWDGECVVVSKTNNHMVYKAWDMSTGQRSV